MKTLTLTVKLDVTELSDQEIEHLVSEMLVQADRIAAKTQR